MDLGFFYFYLDKSYLSIANHFIKIIIFINQINIMATVNWQKEIQPLIKKYKGKKHPLDYNSPYELVVMVVLSAQDSDRHINQLAPEFFSAFPDMKALAKADTDSIFQIIKQGPEFWKQNEVVIIVSLGDQRRQKYSDHPGSFDGFAWDWKKISQCYSQRNGQEAEGIIVDLHVVRVAPRLGIATGTDPKKLEKQMMEVLDQNDWGEVGMAISFLGREICRPTNPKCPECVMNTVCGYFKENN